MRTQPPLEPAGQDAFGALCDALAVVPSPDFTARVRERVRREPMRGVAAWWWLRPALVGAAAATLTLVAVQWNGAPGPVQPAGQTARATTRAAAATGRSAAPPMPSERAVASLESNPPVALATGARKGQGVQPARPGSMPEMYVLVSGDERRALDRLLLAIRTGRASVPPPTRSFTDENGNLAEPPPIEITLLKAIEPLRIAALDDSRSRDK